MCVLFCSGWQRDALPPSDGGARGRDQPGVQPAARAAQGRPLNRWKITSCMANKADKKNVTYWTRCSVHRRERKCYFFFQAIINMQKMNFSHVQSTPTFEAEPMMPCNVLRGTETQRMIEEKPTGGKKRRLRSCVTEEEEEDSFLFYIAVDFLFLPPSSRTRCWTKSKSYLNLHVVYTHTHNISSADERKLI